MTQSIAWQDVCSTFNALSDAVIAVDEKNRVIFWNTSAATTYGISAVETQGQALEELIALEDASLSMEQILHQAREAGQWQGEMFHVTRGGRRLRVNWIGHRLGLAKPGTRWTAWITKNLSRSVEAEVMVVRDLRQAMELFHNIIDYSPDYIYLKDRDLRLVLCNQAIAGAFGKQPADLIGKTDIEIGWASESVKGDPAKGLRGFEQDDREALSGKIVHNPNDLAYLNDGIHIFDTVKYPLRDTAGQIIGMFGISRDITKQRQAEDALRRSEARHSQLFEAMTSGAVVYEAADDGSDFIIRGFNKSAEKIEKVRREEVLGKCVTEAFPGVQGFGLLKVFQRVWRSGQAEYFPAAMYQDDRGFGTWRENFVYRLPTGEIVAIYNDITDRVHTEENLRIKDMAIRCSLNALVIADPQGRITFANQAFIKMWGFENESQVLNRSIGTLVPGENDPQVMVAAMLAAGSFDGEIRTTRAEGTPIYCLLSAAVVKDETGRPICMIGSLVDITDRKLAEMELRESKDYLNQIINCIGDPIFVKDSRHRLVLANAAECALAGVSREELLGKTDYDFFPADQVDVFWAQDDLVLQTGQENVNEEELTDARGEVHIIQTKKNLFTDLAGNDFIVGVIHDITERKRAEEALRTSEERFRSVFQKSPTGIVLVGLDQKFRHANPFFCQMVEYTEEELRQLTFVDITHPDFKERDLQGVRSLMEGRIPIYQTEKIYIKKSGRICYAGLTVTLVSDSSGTPLYFVSMIEDISHRKLAEQEKSSLEGQLRQAQKMEAIGRLAGGVAHDFNNLLTSIIGNIALAMMDLTPYDPLHETLTEINRAAESASMLTRQLLAFSRKQIIELRVIDLNELIEKMQKMLKRLIGEDVDLVTFPGQELGRVKADPGQIEQIIINLAVNSRDAMPDGGKLTVETANATLDGDYCREHAGCKPGDYVMLAVSDNGQGMTTETQLHLFEPFFTTKPKGLGTGLGLATVYGIVKQHEGFIAVYSELGQGTTFKVYLPRVIAEAEAVSIAEETSEMPKGTETILLVEDEQMVRDIALKLLRKLGYKVLHFANAGEALMAARTYPREIQLLMTDVVMPGMNGRLLAQELAKVRPEMKVLFTSGYTDNVIVHHGVLERGIHFISKPYAPQALALKVRAVLDGK